MSNNIAIIIKTAPNRKSLLWLLNSIELSLCDVSYRIYLADEKPLDDWKIDLYNKLRDQGHFVKIWDEPVAVTIARNDLINQLQEENYVLRVDDDFELGGEFNIHALLTVLEQDDIDFCCDVERQIGDGKIESGKTRIESGYIYFQKNKRPVRKFIKDTSWKYKEVNNIRFAKADYMRNLILLKRHCFEKVAWNENLFFSGEHLDFFMSLKKAGFHGAFTTNSIHLHRDDLKYQSINILNDKKWKKNDKTNNKNIEFKNKWGGVPKVSRGPIIDCYNYFSKKLIKLKW